MNSSSSRLDSTADEQASLWAARLEGSSLDAADRAALDTWLAANPAHRALLSEYCQFSADLEQQLPALVAAGAVAMPREQAPARRGWNFKWLAIGSMLAAAAVVAFVLWPAPPVSQAESFASSVAQRRSLTLSDGTRVELNAQTSLRVENGATERRVRLAGGEAYFVVTKDPKRPFIVETPAGSVRVTGTTFNVRAESASELEVIVVEGSVQVHPGEMGGTRPSVPVSLHGGEQFCASAAKGVTRQPLTGSALEDALAWRQGQIVCSDGMPLREAIARFARYHGRGITTTPAVDAAKLNLGGIYDLDDLDGFFTAIKKTWPDVRVTPEPSGIVRVSLRNEP